MWVVGQRLACIWWQKPISNGGILDKWWATVYHLEPVTCSGAVPVDVAFHWVCFLRKLPFGGGMPSVGPQSVSHHPIWPQWSYFIACNLKGKLIGHSTIGNGRHQIHHLYWFMTWAEFWPCHRSPSKLFNLSMLSFHLTFIGLFWGVNEILHALCLGQCSVHGRSDYLLFRFIQGTHTNAFWVFVGTLISRNESLPLDFWNILLAFPLCHDLTC